MPENGINKDIRKKRSFYLGLNHLEQSQITLIKILLASADY